MFCRFACMLAFSVLLVSCASTHAPATTETQKPVYQHDVDTEARPWTHSNFDNRADKFTFALFSDLTGGERDGIFEVAVEQLNLLRPELILSVGDLIEGGTIDRAQLESEWNFFDQRADRARAPVFYTGGNHDLTNPEMWALWEERYGQRYYHFLYKDTLFLVMDTEDNPVEFQRELSRIRDEAIAVIDEQGWDALPGTAYGKSIERTSGRISSQQAAYFRGVISKNPAVNHTFVVMHKPAWQRPDEENFSTIEAALHGRPYTVFYGHEHAYLHEERFGQDYIRLGTTGGVQNPAKEMALDHVTLVTVSGEGVDIANLRMSGIFSKTGEIPAGGNELCFENCN
jgi:hypothetical protein